MHVHTETHWQHVSAVVFHRWAYICAENYIMTWMEEGSWTKKIIYLKNGKKNLEQCE